VISSFHLAVLSGGSSLGFLVFGVYLLARYEGIGVRSLSTFSMVWGLNFLVASAVIAILTGYGFTSGAQIQSISVPPITRAVLIGSAPLSGLLTVSGIFAWLWFVLNYTRRIGRRERIVVVLLGGVTFAVATANGLVGALSSFGLIGIDQSVRANFHQFASVLEVLGTSVAIGVGIALLYATATDYRPFRGRAAVGLSFAIVVPWLVRYLYQFGLVTGFNTISTLRIVGLLVGVVGLWLTVDRYDLFEQLPASRAVGRRTAFDTSDTAIVVVNDENHVSDLNPAARELFGVTSRNVIGRPLDALLPRTVDGGSLRRSEGVTFRLPDSNTVVEAVTATATDEGGESIGRTIVCTDITSERRRQQRIRVLNRVLRHNLRNDLNAVRGYVELIANGNGDTDDYEDRVSTTIDGLITTGNKAQDLENILGSAPFSDSPTRLEGIVERAVEDACAEDDVGAVTIDVPSATTVRINPTVLQSIIEELIENGVRHGDRSAVSVEYDADRSVLLVSDDGPGIPDHEVEVLNNAEETPLEHGSGLGLWLVKWGTDLFGGSVTFDTDDGGTNVRIKLPREHVEAAEPA
jgi:PAS domain S-box-containing protein